MRALIVDDDPVAVVLLRHMLQSLGYEIDVAGNGVDALAMLRSSGARLLVTDWEMPQMNGIDLCLAVRKEDFAGYIYIIMITGRDQPQQKIDGIRAGADNFITKPVNPAELMVCLQTAQRILSLETRDLALFAMAKLAESRDPDTGYHLERVQSYARLLAHDLSQQEKFKKIIDREFVSLIYQTSPLHDIGKVGIPDHVLLKPGKFTLDERVIMQTHSQLGARTLEASLQRFPGAKFLTMARDIAAAHHEKYDGTGYPMGLKGQDIPLCGRIVALADVYDALTSRRIYKPPMTHDQARQIILAESGAHFDPDIVDSFVRNEEHFISIKQRLLDPDIEIESAGSVVEALTEQAAAQERMTMLPTAHGPYPEEILLVEDDPVQLEQLSQVLREAGHNVVCATAAEQAQKLFDAHAPRIIVCDWLLPDGSGLTLCTAVRAAAKTYTQFIMISVQTGQEKILEAFEAGVDDFLRKPLDAGELVARVRAGLRTVRLHDDLAVKNQGSAELNAQLSRLNKRLETMAITDDLTGLYNHRHAKTRLEEQWAMADRYQRPLTLALVDVDRFKQINDKHGHAAGDWVLREVTQLLKRATRTTDMICRVGGDEFLVIFPAQTLEEAAVAVERARTSIGGQAFCFAGTAIRVTVSAGLGMRQKGMSEPSMLLEEVDKALYAAKEAGRNTVRSSSASASRTAA